MTDKPPILETVFMDAGMVADLQHDNCLHMASKMNYRLLTAELERHGPAIPGEHDNAFPTVAGHGLHKLLKLTSGVKVVLIQKRHLSAQSRHRRDSHSAEILDIATLRPLRFRGCAVWFQRSCGLDLDRNLPFLDGHLSRFNRFTINSKGYKNDISMRIWIHGG